jgi:GNAT superfamily N-acetyltransferase
MAQASLVALRDATDVTAFRRTFSAAPRALRPPALAKLAPGEGHWVQFLDPSDQSAEAWIATKGDRCVGRIGAAPSPTRAGVGYVGFFENDVREPDHEATARTLLDAACGTLRTRGVTRAYGPIDRNTWYSYRYTTEALPGPDGFQEPPFAWEPLPSEAYLAAFRAAGFTDVEHYHSVAFRRTVGVSAVRGSVSVAKPGHDLAISRGVSFAPFKRAEDFAESLGPLFELASEGFRESFLFEPLSLEQFTRLYGPVIGGLDYLDLSYFALDETGKPVGFLIAYHDRGYLVFKTLMVGPDQRKKGTAHALMYLALKGADARGIEHGISALVRRGNAGMDAIEMRHMPEAASWRRNYVLMERAV